MNLVFHTFSDFQAWMGAEISKERKICRAEVTARDRSSSEAVEAMGVDQIL